MRTLLPHGVMARRCLPVTVAIWLILSVPPFHPSPLEGQGSPPVRLQVQADPPWPGIVIEVVGSPARAQTDLHGRAVLAVPRGLIEIRGTTPFGETQAVMLDAGPVREELELSFPGLRLGGTGLVVETAPNAQIETDGGISVTASSGGMSVVQPLASGSHRIRAVTADGRSSAWRTVTVERGQLAAISLPIWSGEVATTGSGELSEERVTPGFTAASDFLPPESGILAVASDGSVEVILQGKMVGQASVGRPLSLRVPAGESTVTLTADGRRPQEHIVVIQEGGTTHLSASIASMDPAPVQGDWSPAVAPLTFLVSVLFGIAAFFVGRHFIRDRTSFLANHSQGPGEVSPDTSSWRA